MSKMKCVGWTSEGHVMGFIMEGELIKEEGGGNEETVGKELWTGIQ